MFVVDANSSLRRFACVGERAIADTRTFQSDYYLSPAFVDQFKDEVAAAAAAATASRKDTDNANGSAVCPTNWKAAAELGTWGVFQESGLFASACRHGLILWIADLIRSGEL
jgi:hypothetical protein